MMFDLDDFKKINDEYGHDMWDFVLETLSNVLKQTMRKEDSIYRWWWEEFILLVECWDRDKALNCAEKLRNLISTEVTQRVSEKIEWFNRDITVSIWVHNIYQTVSQNNSTAQQEIFKKVDDASYISKQNGKNRVTFSDEINNSQTK
jgi:diguanylate cyclase (GGDEF)-like protein